MTSKGAPSTSATGRTTPANFRTTRSNAKASTQKTNASPQTATLEKKKAKVIEAEAEARKILISEECLSDETIITHHTLLHSFSLLVQKYSSTAPSSLTRAMTAI